MLPLLLVLWMVPVRPAPAQDETTLERAAKLLQRSPEQDCRDGVDLCVSANSVAAAELLLDVLALATDRGGFLPSAHYRDVAWDGLRRMTDPAVRARVERELAENKKSPQMRQWCAELLGEYRDAVHAEELVRALKDKELEVRRAAARALGKLELPADAPAPAKGKAPATPRGEALAALAKLAKDKDPMLRANAVESAARLDPAQGHEALVRALADADAGVRCALLAAAAELYPDEAEALAERALSDGDWRPRLRAVDVLARRKNTSATGLLVRALADARPAVVARAVRHLQALTGQLHTKREAWEAWWRDQGPKFDFTRPPPARQRSPDATVATYNGIELDSDHVAFLIDRSQGMAAHLASRSTSKELAARDELEAVLTRLEGSLRFSLFTYNDRVSMLDDRGAVDLTAKTRAKALAFVDEERLGGSKNIWEALETAIADPDVDTLFLLSSGEPEVGLYVHWNRVTWHLAEINRFRNVVVHAIAYSDSAWYREQLQKIAEVTGGEFRYFE